MGGVGARGGGARGLTMAHARRADARSPLPPSPSPMGSRQSWADWFSATRGLMPPSQAMGLEVMDSTPPAIPTL